jgi:hypothetical protein
MEMSQHTEEPASQAVAHLDRLGLFQFDSQVIDEIGEFPAKIEEEDRVAMLRELTFLTAAEFALEEIIAWPRDALPVHDPIQVDVRAGRLAMAKSNCRSVVWSCFGILQPAARLTMHDVTAFSSDVAKLVQLGISPDEPPDAVSELADAVYKLEDGHMNHPSDYARALGESGVLRLQGFLWAVKLALPGGDMQEATDGAYEVFRLTEPAGRVPV